MIGTLSKQRMLFPLVIAIWFVLTNVYFVFRNTGSLSQYANFIPYAGEDICDFLCVCYSFLIYLKSDQAGKRAFTFLALAFAFLWSTDILFHNVANSLLNGQWLLRPGHTHQFLLDIPFLCFLLFFSAAAFWFNAMHAEQRRLFSGLSDYVVLMLGLVVFVLFIFMYRNTFQQFDSVNMYLIFQTGCALLSFVLVLLVISRAVSSLHLAFIGFVMLVMVDHAITLFAIKSAYQQIPVTTGFEALWLLASMFMLTGLMQYYYVDVLKSDKDA